MSFLANARAYRDGTREREAVPAQGFDAPAKGPGGGGRGYAQAALDAEAQRVASAPSGTRNDTLNRAAFSLGQLVAGGEITEQEVVNALAAAARGAGLDEHEIGPTIASGLAKGALSPRNAPRPLNGHPTWPGAARTPEAEPAAGPDVDHALFKPGGAFFLNVPQTPPAVWGRDGEVLWAEGEALLIAAPQGVGKTTLAHQLIRARIGLQDSVLGYPVARGRRVLLLCMDRPAQARRAGHRIFGGDDQAILDDRLVIWEGPPPYDLAQRTDLLVAMCKAVGADTVVIDSLKDAAVGLSEDTVGASYNRTRQRALAEGIQIIELHHVVKRGAAGGPPNTLADIYGSTWITSGAGSVILLWGDAGDPVISLRHLKQPMDEIGPLHLAQDHHRGVTEVRQGMDIIALIHARGAEGLTALQAAVVLFETDKPTTAQKEKARRRLEKLCEAGQLRRHDGPLKTSVATYYLSFTGEF